MHRDNLRVEQLSMLLDFLMQICYVDVTSKQPFIKQDAFEGEILFGQSQFQYLLHQQTKSHIKDINVVKFIGQALI